MIIDIQKVQFRYQAGSPLILNLQTLQVFREEKVFLFGPSGCGKTTLLELLAGVIAPQAGSVRILGKDLSGLRASARDQFRADHLGYIFQSFNLIPYLTIFENITLPLYLSAIKRQRVPRSRERSQVLHLCEELGIASFMDRRVGELSIGQQQRVAAARALIGQPELILADEPTSALDMDHREKFIRLLFHLCQTLKTSLVFVSHDRSLQKLFDRSIHFPDFNQVEAG